MLLIGDDIGFYSTARCQCTITYSSMVDTSYKKGWEVFPVSRGTAKIPIFQLASSLIFFPLLPSTNAYSEYRMRGAIDSRDFETASGIRGDYVLSPGVSIKPALEVVNTVDGENNNDAVAISLGYSRTTNPNEKITGHTEFRKASDSRFYGIRASYAARLNLDWTALLREEFSRQDPDLGEMTLQHSLTAGMARRPRLDNRHHMLFLYNWKEERAPGDTADRSVHILSTHHNYQASPDLVVSGRIGGKQQVTHLIDKDIDTSALLVDSRLSWDLNRRWDADFRAGLLCTGDFDSQRLALGVGLHYLVDRNLRLGVAYNLTLWVSMMRILIPKNTTPMVFDWVCSTSLTKMRLIG